MYGATLEAWADAPPAGIAQQLWNSLRSLTTRRDCAALSRLILVFAAS